MSTVSYVTRLAETPVTEKDIPENVWVRTAKMVEKYSPVNLGQGAADYPEVIPRNLKAALISTQSADAPVSYSQYCSSRGHPLLIKELAKFYGTSMGRKIDPAKEVLITVGADESLHSIISAKVKPGEEVILIEPSYDAYAELVKHYGGIPRCIALRMRKQGTTSRDFYIDSEELAHAFNENTKAIIMNTPHNPTGKVFNRKELEYIAELCIKHDCLYVSDEVYEQMVYNCEHIRMATLPGMWERTVTIGSAGKLFNCTGWKIGWMVGPEYLVTKAADIHRLTLYTCATPLQIALADVLSKENKLIGTQDSYWHQLRKELNQKRDIMCQILSDCGFHPIQPEGGYFVTADVSMLGLDPYKESGIDELDSRIVEWMIKEKGIAAIPVSAFFRSDSKLKYDNFIRFCFIKDNKTLDRAKQKLKLLKV